MLKPLLPGICQINAAFHLSSTQGRRKQRGQGGLGPPNLEDLEKKTEAETDNLLIVPPSRIFGPPAAPGTYILRLKPSQACRPWGCQAPIFDTSVNPISTRGQIMPPHHY